MNSDRDMATFNTRGRQGVFYKRRSKSQVTCQYCKGEGHSKENCFKLIGYPKWYKGKKVQRGKRSFTANSAQVLMHAEEFDMIIMLLHLNNLMMENKVVKTSLLQR